MSKVRLGRRPAVRDKRVPRMSLVMRDQLPEPPPEANWFAAIGSWPMLMNDQLGCCVEAAVLHAIQQMSTYAEAPLIPTDAELLDFYEKATGYTPTDPSTDQGSYVMGDNGVVSYWVSQGVTCGGLLNKIENTGVMQITRKNPTEWKQAIHTFGGLLVGIDIPEPLMANPEIPFVWDNPNGANAGGHEVWINGYQTVGDTVLYDFVSWGQRFRMTEEFMMAVTEEVVTLVDPIEINARGLNAAGIPMAELISHLESMRA